MDGWTGVSLPDQIMSKSPAVPRTGSLPMPGMTAGPSPVRQLVLPPPLHSSPSSRPHAAAARPGRGPAGGGGGLRRVPGAAGLAQEGRRMQPLRAAAQRTRRHRREAAEEVPLTREPVRCLSATERACPCAVRLTVCRVVCRVCDCSEKKKVEKEKKVEKDKEVKKVDKDKPKESSTRSHHTRTRHDTTRKRPHTRKCSSSPL